MSGGDHDSELRALTSEAAEKIDLLGRLASAARDSLSFGRRFGVAPRRWLAATGTGVGCATLALVLAPAGLGFALAPLVGVVGASVGALLIHRDIEAQRDAELFNLEERIDWAKRNGEAEILEKLREKYVQLVAADVNELNLVLASPRRQRLLSPPRSSESL